jgi:RHS repeat-associated protein
MMVAVNDGTGLQYLLTDHLGSTVAVTNASGTLTSQQRYLPFGGTRAIPNSPILATDFTYTGQRKLDDGMGGIMDYKARFYSVALMRFLQPDSIIPNAANPQNFNRFSYVGNNPVRFNDPTGHVCSDPDDLWSPSCDGGGGASPTTTFTDYSFWETQVLKKLYKKGGSNAEHGVSYILDNQIHITVGTGWQSWGDSRGAWFDEGNNTITIISESPGNFGPNGDLSLWGLSLIIHEARHIEQGTELSHSKFGEMDAWQIQFDVLQQLGQSLTRTQMDILNAKTLYDVTVNGTTQKGFVTIVQDRYPDYWQKNGFGLYTYPDYPDWCLSLYGCGPEIPWWLRINPP